MKIARTLHLMQHVLYMGPAFCLVLRVCKVLELVFRVCVCVCGHILAVLKGCTHSVPYGSHCEAVVEVHQDAYLVHVSNETVCLWIK